MPYYEVLCLAPGTLSRKELGGLVRRAAKWFMNEGGVVTRLHALGADGTGSRSLAYNIRRNQVTHTTGYYINVCAFAKPDTLKEVCRRLALDEDVLRLLPLRRDISEATAAPADLDYELPPEAIDPKDPTFALEEFLREYETQHPEGYRVNPSETYAPVDTGKGSAVPSIVESLNTGAAWLASDKGRSKSQDPGLQSLLDYKPTKDSDR